MKYSGARASNPFVLWATVTVKSNTDSSILTWVKFINSWVVSNPHKRTQIHTLTYNIYGFTNVYIYEWYSAPSLLFHSLLFQLFLCFHDHSSSCVSFVIRHPITVDTTSLHISYEFFDMLQSTAIFIFVVKHASTSSTSKLNPSSCYTWLLRI